MKRLGIITPFLASHHGAPLIAALYREARLHGAATILVRTIHMDATFDEPLALEQADAWIVIHGAATNLVQRFVQSGRPTCVIADDFGEPTLGSVRVDNRAGVHAAMVHLYDRGHRRFAFVGGPWVVTDIKERHEAFLEFINQRPECSNAGDESTTFYTFNAGREATLRLLKAKAEFSALVACNDATALGAIDALRSSGLRVPEDVAVVGFDNGVDSRTPNDGLTTVDQHLQFMAVSAFADVAQRVINPELPPIRLRCQPEFIPRHSSGDQDENYELAVVARDTVLSFMTVSEETGRTHWPTRDSYLAAYFERLGARLRFGMQARFVDETHFVQILQHFPCPPARQWIESPTLPAEQFPFPSGLDVTTEPGDLVAILCTSVSRDGSYVVALCLKDLNFDREFAPEMVLHEIEVLGQQLQYLRMREKVVSTQASLRETQSELLRAERQAALGTIIAAISHQLNTPLGNSLLASSTLANAATRFRDMVSTGQLMRSDIDGLLETLDDATELLDRNIGIASQLILEFKDILEQKTVGLPERIDFGAFLQDLAEVLRIDCNKAGIRLVLEPQGTITLNSHSHLIAQVIAELVENALMHAFADNGVGEIRIKASGVEDAVEIVISDNGVGLPSELIERIFDPFFTTRFGRSRGLGLTLVNNLVSGPLCGSISANVVVTGGAQFTLILPNINPARND